VTLLLIVTDQTTNLFKVTFQRLRPCNNPDINSIIRLVKPSNSFSFFSGHAANSMATMTFLYLLLKKYYRYAFLVFLFPLIFAYSRIYLGLHYPLDILTGYVFGATFGYIAYKWYQKYVLKNS
jgi:undecaprenyl-diphosphatase